MPTKRSGSRAVRTKSQVSKFTSIREATGKRRSSAAGRVARTYFDPWSALRRLTHIRAGRTASQSPVCPDWTAAPLQRLSVLRDPPPDPGRSRLSYSEMRERLKDLVFCVQSSLKLLFSSRCCVSRRIGIKCLFFLLLFLLSRGFWVGSVWRNKQCFQICRVCAQVKSGGEISFSVLW